VRQDLREDDLRKEARTIRNQLLRPLVALRFGVDAPVPYFRRRPKPIGGLSEFASLLSSAVNDLGLRVPAEWAHESLGIPRATVSEPAVRGRGE
jgi:phage gp29-like protein